MNTQNFSPPAVRRARVRGNRAPRSVPRAGQGCGGTAGRAARTCMRESTRAAPAYTLHLRRPPAPVADGAPARPAACPMDRAAPFPSADEQPRREAFLYEVRGSKPPVLPCPPKATQTCRTQRYGCARTRCWGMVVRSRGRCTQGAACGSVAHCPRGWPVRRGEAAGGKPRAAA